MKRLLLLAIATMYLTSCGQGSGTGTGDVKANFVGRGYSVRVDQTSVNTYKFTVVENKSFPGTVFTVYGLQDESQISSFNTSSRMRLAHVADGHAPGQTFEVTFNSDDSVFIIYEDGISNGSFVYSTLSEMVRGQFRQ